MIKIDSQALGEVNAALGLSGTPSPSTELLDATVDQVLEVGQIVRRSRTLAGSQGIFYGAMVAEHAGSGTLTVTVNPYDVPVANAIAPYPAPMPRDFDVWFLGASVLRDSGTGTWEGVLELLDTNVGWGEDDGGDPEAPAQVSSVLAAWTAIRSSAGREFGTLGPDVQGFSQINAMRIPQGGSPLFFFSSLASAAATYSCFVRLGVFPTSLGQDAAV